MEAILKQIKADLKSNIEADNLKIKHYKYKKQDILEYQTSFSLNRKKHFLNMRFILQKLEQTLSFSYRCVCTLKNLNIDEEYTFANKELDILPGVNPVDREKLRDIYKYVVKDNKIINDVLIEDQYKVILPIFKDNYKSIIKYAKNLVKTKRSSD